MPLTSTSSLASRGGSSPAQPIAPSVAVVARDWLGGTTPTRVGVVVLGALFVGLVFAQGWINEDAFILFRTVDNFHQGLGLRWNTFERVQSYSCPSWTLLLTALDTFGRNPFLSAILLSLVCAAGTYAACVAWCRGAARWRLPFLMGLLITSKSFIDYSSSGLENPLAHLLLVAVAVAYLRHVARPPADGLRSAYALLAAAALLVLTRQDMALMAAPFVLHVLVRLLRAIGPKRVAIACLACGIPIWLWEAFSLLYYGFLVPNTAYAKLGHGGARAVMNREAWQYLMATIQADPITVAIVACGILTAILDGDLPSGLLVAGVVAYLLYLVDIGGDWMLGRFVAAPVLASSLVLARRLGPRAAALAAGVLLVANVRAPLAPIKFWTPYPAETVHLWGVIDAKGAKYGPKEARRLLWRARPYEEDPVFQAGVAFRNSADAVVVRGDVGRFGYGAGPDKIVVDSMGLTDPLLARLPADRIRRSGHYQRDVPPGYLETLVTGENRIRDAGLAAYYGHLKSVTQGPLFSPERLRDVLAFNLGRHDHLKADYVERHRDQVRRLDTWWLIHGGLPPHASPSPSAPTPPDPH